MWGQFGNEGSYYQHRVSQQRKSLESNTSHFSKLFPWSLLGTPMCNNLLTFFWHKLLHCLCIACSTECPQINHTILSSRKKTPTSLALGAGLSLGSYRCQRYGERNEGYCSKLHQERLFTGELPLPHIPRKLEPDAAYCFRL